MQVQQRLVSAMNKLAQMPDFAEHMAQQLDPAFIGPPKAREYVQSEMQKWRKATQQPGMRLRGAGCGDDAPSDNSSSGDPRT